MSSPPPVPAVPVPMAALRRWLMLAAAIPLAWAMGFLVFVATLPGTVSDIDSPTDAIVVLTGGSERLATGLALLEQNKAPLLFVSGVHRGVDVQEILRLLPGHHPHLKDRIVLGHLADDTVGNATETSAWVRLHQIRSIRLVTGAYHMPRALLEMTYASPDTTIVLHPVFPESVKNRDWWRWPGTAGLLATEYSKYLAVTFRHWIRPRPS